MTKATNSALMRQKNQKMILSLINRGPISRADIAKETGLTKAAVTIIVDELKGSGIVTEEKSGAGSVGRTPFLLYLAGGCVYVLGINIRRVGINVGIADICGNILCERELPYLAPERAYPEIGRTVNELIRGCGIDKEKIYKAAAVTPGPVDSTGGTVLNPPNFAEWHGADIVESLKGILGCEVILGNVSSALAVAEKYFGSAKDSDNFLSLIIDEGIGSGIFTGGDLFGGSCELGHISIRYDGKKCECGNCGCLEKYASVPDILKGTPYSSWQECVSAGDMEIVTREAEYLSCAIVTANNIFDLDKVVLCGELAQEPEVLLPLIHKKSLSKMILKKDFSVLPGTVSSMALAAASLAVHDFFTF